MRRRIRSTRLISTALAVVTIVMGGQLVTLRAAQAAADPVIAAVGNIACDPADPAFNGGNGTASACQMKATGSQVKAGNYKAVLPLGDNQYEDGTAAKFKSVYDKYWGPVKSISRPVPGNHEYLNSGAAGYFGYFGAKAGTKGQGWYSYDIGSWHLIALNSNCASVGGCGAGSPQETWLRNDLAAHPNSCTLAYWHHARFSSGEDGNNAISAAFWQDLYRAGAELVLDGHAHEYERFAPQTPSGAVDTTYGIREFVDGTGGKGFEPTAPRAANSEVLANGIFGFLTLTLKAGSYTWNYVPAAGSTFSDSGSGTCHGAPPVGLPTAPQGVDGTAGDGQVAVAWGAPASDGGNPVTSYTVTASPGGRSVTVSGETLAATMGGLANGTAYTFTVTATNAGGTSPPSTASRALTPRPAPAAVDYPSAVLSSGPAAYWRLDETGGGTTTDASGNGRTGWFGGGVALGQPGAVTTGTAVSFDGSTGVVGIDDAAPLRLNGPFTVEMWAKQNAFANPTPGLLRKGAASSPDGYLVWYGADGTVHFKRNGIDVATAPGAINGSYHSLVLTYDGAAARWYVDGALSTTTAATFPGNNGTESLVLGQGDQPGSESLDELAVYPSALSASTVTAHVQAGLGGGGPVATAPDAPTGVSATGGDGAATVSWTAPANNGGQPVTSYVVRSSGGQSATVSSALVSTTMTGLTNEVSYTFTVAATNSVGTGTDSAASNAVTPHAVVTSSYASTVLADAPIAYWRLGESSGSSAADTSGSGTIGTYSGGVTLGRPGAVTGDTAAAFNGSDGRVSVADSSALHLNGAFTIEVWAQENSFANSWPGILGKGASGTANGYLLWYQSDGTVHFKRNNIDVATSPGAVQVGVWHHLAVTYDGATTRLYVDGALVTTRATSYPSNASTAALQLGYGDQAGAETLDEVALYATALPASRVAAHFAAAGH